jgi:inorganic pyrophosphatase
MNLTMLEAWNPKAGTLNVVIETSKGSRNKLSYNAEQQLFELTKVLPRGMIFPFDFGFVPSTLGDDGDPLDVLVLLDEPVPAGCKIPARLIGVIEAEEVEDGEPERNDRLVAIAQDSHEQRDVHSLKELNKSLTQQIEHFFVSYNDMSGKQFKLLGCHGPNRAAKLVKEGAKRFRRRYRRSKAPVGSNGKK